MIRIQNIYHMLAYAFQVLREQGYRDVATEEFANTAELCAEILARGISSQLKRGLGREYLDRTEALSALFAAPRCGTETVSSAGAAAGQRLSAKAFIRVSSCPSLCEV